MFIADKNTLHKLQRIFEHGYTLEEVAYIYDFLRHTNNKNNYYSTGFLEQMVNGKPDDLNKRNEELYLLILWCYLSWDVTVDDYFVDSEKIKTVIGIGVDMTKSEKYKLIYGEVINNLNKYYNLRELQERPNLDYISIAKNIAAENPEYSVVGGWVR